MKKIVISMMLMGLLIGCAGWDIPDGAVIEIMISGVASEVGCEVSKLDPEVDFILRNLYDLARTGQLSPELLGRLTSELRGKLSMRPTLVNTLLELVVLLGGEVNPGGDIVSMTGIDERFLNALSRGYVNGFEMCRGMK